MRLAVRCLVLLQLALATPVQSETLVIPGAGPPELPLRNLAAAYQKIHPGADLQVPPSTGIAGGIRAIQNGESVLARIARRLTSEEEKSGLSQVVYAADAVVFAIGANVAIESLSQQQLAEIFSGKHDNWRQVGGPPGQIRVLVREQTEIAHATIRRHLPAFSGLRYAEHAKLANADFEMVELLDRYKSAIGWLTRSSLPGAKSGIRALAVDGIAPSPENVQSGRYRMVVDHVLIFRPQQLTAGAKRFIEFVRSDAGSGILRQSGVIPVDGRRP